jgi:hypothetical protein
MNSGRSCPLHYRYVSSSFSRTADVSAETIYVIGGLYGNVPALHAILELVSAEPVAPTLIFNGDFNWFNIDATSFSAINLEVLKHVVLRGNVETELGNSDDAGCGCAYPEYVDDADVERSNAIMQRLRSTARSFPETIEALATKPMHIVAAVGGLRFGVVHGDAESLAGWRFSHDSLHDPDNIAWLKKICRDANLAGFASSHTCLPTFRRFAEQGRKYFVINNGAAGMPNFSHTQYGLISRISLHAATEGISQYGAAVDGVYIDAIPVHYDSAAFEQTFIENWPEGSAAHHSYFHRIVDGPAYASPHALGLIRAPLVCA